MTKGCFENSICSCLHKTQNMQEVCTKCPTLRRTTSEDFNIIDKGARASGMYSRGSGISGKSARDSGISGKSPRASEISGKSPRASRISGKSPRASGISGKSARASGISEKSARASGISAKVSGISGISTDQTKLYDKDDMKNKVRTEGEELLKELTAHKNLEGFGPNFDPECKYNQSEIDRLKEIDSKTSSCSCYKKTDSEILRQFKKTAEIRKITEEKVEESIISEDWMDFYLDTQKEETGSIFCSCELKTSENILLEEHSSKETEEWKPIFEEKPCPSYFSSTTLLGYTFTAVESENGMEELEKESYTKWISESQLKAENYLSKHRIKDVFQYLGTQLLANIPANPIQFLIKLLDKCLKYRCGCLNTPPLIFTERHIESLFKSMDPLGLNFIDVAQYNIGMFTLGIKKYSENPPLNKYGQVSKDNFISEALACLIRDFNELIKDFSEVSQSTLSQDSILRTRFGF